MDELNPFEDIAPYNDEEAAEALSRLAEHPNVPWISKYIFSNQPETYLRDILRSIRTGELERKTKDSNFRFVDYGRPYRAFGETDIAAACNDRLSNGLLVTELLIRVDRDLDSAVCLLFDGILQEQHLLMLQGVFCVDVTDDQFIGCFAAGCGTFITATAASFAASCERDHRHAQAQENDKYFLHHDNFLLLLNNDNRPWWPHL